MIDATGTGSHWPRKEILCTVDEFLEKMQKESGIKCRGNNVEEALEDFIVNSGYAEYFRNKEFQSFVLKMIHAAEVNGIGGLMPTRIFENEVEEMRWYAENKAGATP